MTEQKISIRYRNRSDLKLYERNVMQHPESQLSQIAESIKTFGWTNPVLIDEHGEIIAGHGRVAAAERLNIESIPTITLHGLSDVQKRAYRLADNKLPLGAAWDSELLKLEIADLIDSDFDLQLTGFSGEEIDSLLAPVQEMFEDEDPYTAKIDTPVYEPSEYVPEVSDLYDQSKTQALKKKIKDAKLPPDVEKFLLSAAERHTVFNFNKIADFYVNADAGVQELFEDSALVIIDYEKAIEQGFVQLTRELVEIVHGDGGEDNAE